LTVSAVSYGTIRSGAIIVGPSIQPNTIIMGLVVNGGVGTYTVSISPTTSSNTITISELYYAGGGGGGARGGYPVGTAGLGGAAPGRSGAAGYSGLAYTGGGGGGTGSGTNILGGNGGSGVVILAIPSRSYTGITAGSPTVSTTTRPNYTILTYTSSGSYTA
jgi:hypothetical protein